MRAHITEIVTIVILVTRLRHLQIYYNSQTELNPEESGTDLTSSTSMAVEPSNSAEKRILDLVAEGGEDAIKPSPTRTIVSAGENKRKLELAMSASGLQRKKERVARFVIIII